MQSDQIVIYAGAGPEVAYQYAVESKIYKNWIASVDPTITIESITVQAVDFRDSVQSPETVMFVRLKVRASNTPHDQIVELRGGSAVIFVVLRCVSNNKIREYVVLIEQFRLAVGISHIGLPAGMIDGGTVVGAAVAEVEQEVGIKITESDLMPLSEEGLYTSPGLLDELVHYFLVEKEVSPDEIAALQGKATGIAEEYENLTVRVVPLSDVTQVASRNGIAHTAYMLYLQFKGII